MNVVFAGPTISHEEIRRHHDCVCLPPVSHGDILRVLQDKPAAIGIIDGYFEGAPSVWHKEILYALDQGVRVYGSSSMGALRAVELYPFGMKGVGQVFQWYRDGVITDDDEVAVLHGPEQVGFVMASEPMVNIRATLALACQQQVINDVQKSSLLDIAKNTFYKKRRWSDLLEAAIGLFENKAQARLIAEWLQQNRVDLKKQDARCLLAEMHQDAVEDLDVPPTDFHFEWTVVWDVAFKENERMLASAITLTNDDRKVLDQLRLYPEQYERYQDKSLLNWMSFDHAETIISDSALKTALNQFRAHNRLASRSMLMSYLERADLDESKLTALMHGVSRLESHRRSAGDLQPGIIDQLKLDGQYFRFLDLANLKIATLASAEIDSAQSGLLPPQLIAWYFEKKLGGAIPPRLDIHLAKNGFEGTDHFHQLIGKEYLYWKECR
ncbi:TfuA-like protein [Granulosicoccus antarcticus]|uniref:TfuA-like core domain-containing protein n=1 Tax=Granulosicoccus antarcticus IMCC3135 TaxID=1192854 RepID=A0A2Z2NLM1_9GAMM|nr:TfuA-like protein [Granulosicoccus antarcticus]ASJ71445.1 hypothetical protein IMCC3135_06690 [Granulosicoccus antarcticus IMCC3135]